MNGWVIDGIDGGIMVNGGNLRLLPSETTEFRVKFIEFKDENLCLLTQRLSLSLGLEMFDGSPQVVSSGHRS